jgi:hypothetical protein
VRLTKREFLITGVRVALSMSIGGLAASPASSYAQVVPPYLGRDEKEVFRAIIKRLVPADDDPGVTALGLGNRVEAMLRVTPDVRPLIPLGLAGVNETSRLTFDNRGFLELSDSERDRVLEAVERGDAAGERWRTLSSAKFFDIIRTFTVGVYYSEPVVWPSIGFPGPGQPGGHSDYADFHWD